MKKLLIMLMVVTMASFLFVGCLGITPPIDPDDPDDPLEPTSTAPAIIGIYEIGGAASLIVDPTATDTEYIDKTEADFIVVSVLGIAGPEALIQVYIGSAVLPIALGEAGKTGFFEVFMTISSLGDDGAKTLYATATEVALDESASSNVVNFTLDTAAPEIVSVTADISKGTVIVTFDEAIDEEFAEDETLWAVEIVICAAITAVDVDTAELISPKVVELGVTYTVAGVEAVDDKILVTCETIEDLAGNLGTDYFEICELVE